MTFFSFQVALLHCNFNALDGFKQDKGNYFAMKCYHKNIFALFIRAILQPAMIAWPNICTHVQHWSWQKFIIIILFINCMVRNVLLFLFNFKRIPISAVRSKAECTLNSASSIHLIIFTSFCTFCVWIFHFFDLKWYYSLVDGFIVYANKQFSLLEAKQNRNVYIMPAYTFKQAFVKSGNLRHKG